ncbi:hypothetical protein EIKCOROL_01357 [Eikenella corrodens ATCC 23834]|uniref:Uncharacterized protein n=1 Tax=Eikenella corrodens ATCC 23834 TaxID=546274 RepID=C0DVG8_EIKCO|nr:hypothetical protein EIKCOROL_01357 [Eikenella corrodens ATCC 23834]
MLLSKGWLKPFNTVISGGCRLLIYRKACRICLLPACCQRLPENGKCPIKHFQVAPSLFSVTHLTGSRLPEKNFAME